MGFLFLLIKDKLYKFLKLIETERAEWPGIHFKASCFIHCFLQPARKTKRRRRRVSGRPLACEVFVVCGLPGDAIQMLFRSSQNVSHWSSLQSPKVSTKPSNEGLTSVHHEIPQGFKCPKVNFSLSWAGHPLTQRTDLGLAPR
jgi:hypothetical protein